MSLTLKQQRFIDEYLIDGNATASYIRAGYSANTNTVARVEAFKLLTNPNILAALAERRQIITEKVELRQEDVVREMKTLAFSCVDHYQIDEKGHLKLAQGAPKEAMRAVSSVKRRVIHQGEGKNTRITYETEFRLWDKSSMVRLSGEYLQMFEGDDKPVNQVNNFFLTAPPQLLLELASKIEAMDAEYTVVEP